MMGPWLLLVAGCAQLLGVYAVVCEDTGARPSTDGGTTDGGAEACEGLVLDLTSENPASPADEGAFAYSLSLGDVDGDGQDEVVAGAPLMDGKVGQIFVLDYVAADPVEATITVGDPGESTAWHTGFSVHAADLDGDGIADLSAGAPSYGYIKADAGLAWVWFGPVAEDLTTYDADLSIEGPLGAFLGASLGAATLGDETALLVGAPAWDPAKAESSLALLLRPGGDYVDIDDEGDDAIRIYMNSEAMAGWDLGAADFDGDGIDEVVVAVPYWQYDSFKGAVMVVQGDDLVTALDEGEDVDLELFRSAIITSKDVQVGASVTTGDLDQDGIPELFLGALFEEIKVGEPAAAAFIVDATSSGLFGLSGLIELPDDAAATIEHEPSDGYHMSGAMVGDLDHDGSADLWLGQSVTFEVPEVVALGPWLLSGPLSGTVSLADAACTAPAPETFLTPGHAVVGGTDVTGDGAPDLLAGVPFTSEGIGALAIYSGCCE